MSKCLLVFIMLNGLSISALAKDESSVSARKPASRAIVPNNANYVLTNGTEEVDPDGICEGVVSLKPDSMKTLDFLRAIYPTTKIKTGKHQPEKGIYKFNVYDPDYTGPLLIQITFRNDYEFTWHESLPKSKSYKGPLCRNALYQAKGVAEE